jgi:membrane-bound lytic murein transglycosylase C
MKFSKIAVIVSALLLSGCTVSDYRRIVQVAQNPSSDAVRQIAIDRAITYAANPSQFEKDVEHIRKNYVETLLNFRRAVIEVWGEADVVEPSPKDYAKYTDNYKSRAHIDFERGVIRVETIDDTNPKTALQKAIVTTLLTPDDPTKIDLYSAQEIKLEGTPFLAGQVKDYDGKIVLYSWRANRYADMLIDKVLQTKKQKNKTIYYVDFAMEQNALDTRAAKYSAYVNEFAKKFNVEKSLVYAIIEAESSFNPYAVSHIPAYGLMQIVPTTAGIDSMAHVKGVKQIPSKQYLFNPKNNIELGTGYINLLQTRYLKDISHPLSKEYAVISAYNTGAGNVLRTFDANKAVAFNKINTYAPNKLYEKLVKDLPYAETRRYLQKVTNNKKKFIVYEG